MIKYYRKQISKFLLIGVLVFLAGYFAAAQSEQCHQQDIQNRTEVGR
jgi:hypothetical protein